MNIFKSDQDSHQHSLQTLNLLANFMLSVRSVVDMGSGSGMDIAWWANKTYLDDSGQEIPHNYKCLGIDLDTRHNPGNHNNLRFIESDFEEYNSNVKADVIWSHDSFRYAVNPLMCLRNW